MADTLSRLPANSHALATHLAQQVFPQAAHLAVMRVPEGQSTWVYRLTVDETPYYLRVLPEVDASFAPELYVHQQLRAQGVPLPHVVYFEHLNPAWQRSIMTTDAMPGAPLSDAAPSNDLDAIVQQAGRALARIHQLPVAGFGWVQRDRGTVGALRGEQPTFTAWMQPQTEQALHTLTVQGILTGEQIKAMEAHLAAVLLQFNDEPACLAHGDFDLTHIFQQAGQFTGIIDFGEIRGAPACYDLGHFAIENAHRLPALLAGYQQVMPLSLDITQRIQQMALLIALNRMGRRAARGAAVLEIDRRFVAQGLAQASDQ